MNSRNVNATCMLFPSLKRQKEVVSNSGINQNVMQHRCFVRQVTRLHEPLSPAGI